MTWVPEAAFRRGNANGHLPGSLPNAADEASRRTVCGAFISIPGMPAPLLHDMPRFTTCAYEIPIQAHRLLEA